MRTSLNEFVDYFKNDVRLIKVYDGGVSKHDYPNECDLCGKENHGDLDMICTATDDDDKEMFLEDPLSCCVFTFGRNCRRKIEKQLGYKIKNTEEK